MNSQDVVPVKVSPSKLGVYRDCPKKYDYIYRQALQPISGRKAHFDKGNYFHELSHVYYQQIQAGATPGSDFLLASILNRIRRDLDNASPENVAIYGNITKVMTRFIKEQSPKIDEGITVLGVEEEINVDVTTPSGNVVTLFGYVDLIYSRNGQIRIRDHKTGERAWTNAQAEASPQLLFYGGAKYYSDRSVPALEISYINTHDYKKGMAKAEQAFTFASVQPTATTYDNFLNDTLHLIDEMLESRPTPHYDDRMCLYCPFWEPCRLERKGIDPARILASNFKPRDESRIKFSEITNEHTNGDTVD
jgi:hypothetical protein